MQDWTYHADSHGKTPPFRIVFKAQGRVAAAVKASEIGMALGLLLVGPHELRGERVYF